MRGRKTVKLGWMEKGEYCKGDKGHIMRKAREIRNKSRQIKEKKKEGRKYTNKVTNEEVRG